MKDMATPGESDCPFEFNFNADTFHVDDIVSYRVPERFDDMPFVGRLVAVEADHVLLVHDGLPGVEQKVMRGTRESRPVVSAADALE
jgi:hypothetical protein